MELAQQSDFIDCLAEIASSVKNTRDVQRQSCLVQALQTLSMSMPPVFRLPLNPALQCCDVDLQVGVVKTSDNRISINISYVYPQGHLVTFRHYIESHTIILFLRTGMLFLQF